MLPLQQELWSSNRKSHPPPRDLSRSGYRQPPHPTPPTIPDLKCSPPNPSKLRPITAAEVLQFGSDPELLYGRQFILSPDTDASESTTYEVIGYSKKRDKSIEYEVLFDDCPEDPIMVGMEEMKDMLRDSFCT